MTDKEFLDYITPKKSIYTPIRLGKLSDGGYICPKELVAKAKKCFSFGIWNDVSFEKDLLKENQSIVIDSYDGSIPSLPEQINMVFNKQHVYFASSSNKIFSECKEKFILKMDIEGEEYNLPAIDKKDLENMLFLTFEMHWLQRNKDKAKLLCEYLNDAGFYCFHLHGNNCASNQFAFDNEECPETIEITCINRNIEEFSEKQYPISEIDYPNDPKKKDLQLQFIKNRQSQNAI